MKADIVGFTGTRSGMTPEQRKVFTAYLRAIWLHKEFEFHHGDCVGSDAEAHHIAVGFDARITIHPPINFQYRAMCTTSGQPLTIMPAQSYLDRNKDIADACTELVACPGEMEPPVNPRGHGTWYTIRYAKQLGKPVFVIYPDGTTSHHK